MVMLFFIQRPRLVADVLRRLPGRALRGHQPLLVRGRRPGAVRAWARGSSTTRARPSPTASTRGCTRSTRALRRARAAATRSRSRSSRRPTAASSAAASARRVLDRSADSPLLPAAQTDLIYSVIVNELGLIGACAVLCTYLLAVERGFKIATLARDSFSKLLATGPDRGLRAAGLRHRRRRHARHPADRRDAALHLLRRLVDPGQLRAAGAAAADLRPRAARGDRAAMNAPIARLFVVVVVLFARARRASRRAGRCSTPMRCATTRKNHRELLEEQQIRRGHDPRRRRHACWPARSSSADERLRAHLSARAGCSPTPWATASCARAAPGSSASTTTTSPGAASELGSLIDQPVGHRAGGRRPAHDARPRPRSASRCSSSPGARAPSSRWTRARARSRSWPRSPATTPTRVKDQRAVQRAQPRPRTRRCSTARRRPATRRARRSRSSPRSPRIDSGRYTPDSRISGRNGKTISGVPLQQRLRRVLRRHHAHRRR